MGKHYTQLFTNPRSLANLQHEGRQPQWGSKKSRHNLSLSDEGWALLQALAQENGYSVSELLERWVRGGILLHPPSAQQSNRPQLSGMSNE